MPASSWTTVVNNGQNVPGTTKHFNSYSQPSVNNAGLVVFRGRTQGSDGGSGGEGEAAVAVDSGGSQAVRGVYSRDMATPGSPVTTVAQTGQAVPQPNNTGGAFNEFPSFPRISVNGSSIVTRGQSTPVWTYSLDGTDTRVGTSGVYLGNSGSLTTGASLLGVVPGYEQYSVPGTPAGTRFDQFPGSPAVDGQTIVFKGNYTEETSGKTGVFFRDVSDASSPVQLIASSATVIPNQPAGGAITFGSTAPPSAAGGRTVFTAWDNENAPTYGGVYLADTAPTPTLQTIAGIGEQVPGQAAGTSFTNFGEGLSFDGRYVAFWGTWGSETRNVTLTCSTDGNKDVLAYCQQEYPNGFLATIPVHQGIFVYDTATHLLNVVATTGAQFTDFTYWVFSGAPPGVGGTTDATREPPRWRSSAFAAVSAMSGKFQVAFKGTTADGVVGIYAGEGPGTGSSISAVVDTATPGTTVDPQAPAGSLVSAVGIERDGFRGGHLALSVSMLNAATAESWSGIYETAVPTAETTTTLSVTASALKATVSPVPPASGTPTGTVTFTVSSKVVGTAPVTAGIATLSYTIAAGTTPVISATYSGDGTFLGSSATLTSYNPQITAALTSAYPKTSSGWYRSPVTVSFTCTSGVALTAPCPVPVTLKHNGAWQSVTRTITAVNGTKASVTVRGINIDQTRPWVSVGGVYNGAVYFGTAPTPRCSGGDALSGLASCTVARNTSGERTTYTVTATDRAGNVAALSGSYVTLSKGLIGATYANGIFTVKAGHTYTVVVYSATQPTLYRPVVYPRTPYVKDKALWAAGYHRWTTSFYASSSLRSSKYWNLGLKIGSTMQLLTIHVQ